MLEVGDQRDAGGKEVSHSTREFTPESKGIYVNAGVKGLAKGQKVKGTLQATSVKAKDGTEYRDTEVASKELESPDVEATFRFDFTPPKKGWPVGTYEVRLSTNGKAFETVELTVK